MLNAAGKITGRIGVYLTIGICAMLLSACIEEGSKQDIGADCNCSIVQLIASPQNYDGKRVRIIGVAMQAESQDGIGHIYLSRDDARYLNDSNSIWIDIRGMPDLPSIETFNGQFVVVVGTFTSRDRLLMIENVTDIRILSPLPLDESRFDPGI